MISAFVGFAVSIFGIGVCLLIAVNIIGVMADNEQRSIDRDEQ